MAGRAKENLPGGSLKYLLVYLKTLIFKCRYRKYISYISRFFCVNISFFAGEPAPFYGFTIAKLQVAGRCEGSKFDGGDPGMQHLWFLLVDLPIENGD